MFKSECNTILKSFDLILNWLEDVHEKQKAHLNESQHAAES